MIVEIWSEQGLEPYKIVGWSVKEISFLLQGKPINVSVSIWFD